MSKTVLISGAGIAGLTLAHWLSRYGYQVTVVESSAGLRLGGAAVDVRGEALKIADRMGVLDPIRAVKVTTSVEFVDAQNNCIATLKNFGEDAAGQDIEVHRDDLAAIIYGVASTGVLYVFNNQITAIEQGTNKVNVSFNNGPDRDFDLLIGADGVHSKVRNWFLARMVFLITISAATLPF